MAGLITRQLGGEWKAQALACFAVLLAPIQIGISSFYSMNVDRICTYSFARLVVTPNYYRTAIILVDSVCVLLGIGVMNKHTFAVPAGFILVGLLFTSARKEFLKKNLDWYRSGFPHCSSNLIWQISHNFVSLEFYRNASELKMSQRRC